MHIGLRGWVVVAWCCMQNKRTACCFFYFSSAVILTQLPDGIYFPLAAFFRLSPVSGGDQDSASGLEGAV